MIDWPVVMNHPKEKMKTLTYVLSLATLATGCAGFEITADGGPEKEEKVEVTGSLSPAALQAWVAAWLGEVTAKLGVHPMIYTSPNFWKNAMSDTTCVPVADTH